MRQGKIPRTAAHHRPYHLGTSISGTRALPCTRSFFQPSAASYHDPDDVLPRDSPQMQPHRTKLLPSPSPPHIFGRPSHGRRKLKPLVGDAVLVAHLGNGIMPEIAHAAALEPLDTYSDSDSEEQLPKAFDLSDTQDADAQSPPIRSNHVIHSTISKDRTSGSESLEAAKLAYLGRRMRSSILLLQKKSPKDRAQLHPHCPHSKTALDHTPSKSIHKAFRTGSFPYNKPHIKLPLPAYRS